MSDKKRNIVVQLKGAAKPVSSDYMDAEEAERLLKEEVRTQDRHGRLDRSARVGRERERGHLREGELASGRRCAKGRASWSLDTRPAVLT
jgi:hypothetical protein